MMKKISVPVLLIISLAACRSKTVSKDKDSLSIRSVITTKSIAAETQELVKEFKPMLAGFWMNMEYIDEIKRTKSAQRAYEKVGWITDMQIDTANVKADSLLVNYNSGYHEVFNLIIKFQSGNSKSSITAYDPINSIERRFYELKFDKTSKLLTIYAYNKLKKLIDSAHFFKDLNTHSGDVDPDKLVINKILISGNYTLTDSLKNNAKVSLTSGGKVTGLNNFKSYEVLTDFMTPPNNLDQIGFDTDKKRKWYGFKINADTLSIYETKDAPDSVDLVLTNLKYKLVRQK